MKQEADSVCMPLYTLKGSIIKRYMDDVGKLIDDSVYVHRRYMKKVIPNDLLEWILKYLPYGTEYNTVMWDRRLDTIRFDEALNFDTEREPCAGNFVVIDLNGNIEHRKTSAIWHHKWLWVKDGYKEFDVKESYEWSKLWLSKLGESASGSSDIWKRQLKEVGL